MGWLDDAVEDIVEDLTELLVKVLLSGLTLTLSTPTIALATLFNNQIGYVDPLLYPATPIGFDKPLPMATRYSADTVPGDTPTEFRYGVTAESGRGKQPFSRGANVIIDIVTAERGDHPA